MLKISKIQNENKSFDIHIYDGTKDFQMLFGGNLDLSWNLFDTDKSDNTRKFSITKADYYLFSLFEQLWLDIQNCNILDNFRFELNNCDTIEELEEINLKREQRKAFLKNEEAYKKLFLGSYIEWRSDDSNYDSANSVVITKLEDEFLFSFINREKEFGISKFSVRFRNVGSSYKPFNLAFMDLFNKLQEYEPEYSSQIHIEEYLYNQKIKVR